MVNLNGNIIEQESVLSLNRAFLYGDAVFETLKVVNGKVLFIEDHYFRLMASMRIVRMQIPMNFTLENLEQYILDLAVQNSCSDSCRVRFTVYRNDGGYYLPTDRKVSFLISTTKLDSKAYQFNEESYEVELFKDFYLTKQLLSTIKSTNKLINTVGSIFADENGYQNCLLLNEEKNVVEALNGNLFMISGNRLITPPLSEGCLNGIMRKQVLALANKTEGLEVFEEPISPFDLQKSDELFITNVIQGIQPITKYRKKDFTIKWAKILLEKVNQQIEIS
ncbi:aminotransferase class IV [Flavobacterium piscinae]|uniref:branched-chain-amino-acid transaminase n=1 Tax=Flavobacterium piscinae TaxID=2506424 RepID=A0A4Q1KP81_9FLAO|nr:aminotransferase class IV [Flavobacterium piscinae]MBC8884520.1 aminotransferase class IV [Flavobacterium piscinae]RXR31788.1 aminotransferase class IV [Flavobacterium piscinae]